MQRQGASGQRSEEFDGEGVREVAEVERECTRAFTLLRGQRDCDTHHG